MTQSLPATRSLLDTSSHHPQHGDDTLMQDFRRLARCEDVIAEQSAMMQRTTSRAGRDEIEDNIAILELRRRAASALVHAQITLEWCRAERLGPANR
jgi:hypothetical protein